MLVRVGGSHYKGLRENQATVAGVERQICDNKNSANENENHAMHNFSIGKFASR